MAKTISFSNSHLKGDGGFKVYLEAERDQLKVKIRILRLLLSKLEGRLQLIDRALEKCDEGTYGICDTCRAPIDLEGLEVSPYITKCWRCLSQQRN